MKFITCIYFPVLTYCVEIWGNAANIYLDSLVKLQKKIIRVLTFSQYLAHTNDLFAQLQILPFKKLVIHRIGLQMFKNNLGYIPKAVKSLFTTNSDIHKYTSNIETEIKCDPLMVSMSLCIAISVVLAYTFGTI